MPEDRSDRLVGDHCRMWFQDGKMIDWVSAPMTVLSETVWADEYEINFSRNFSTCTVLHTRTEEPIPKVDVEFSKEQFYEMLGVCKDG